MKERSLTVVAVVFLVSAAVSAGAGALRGRAAPLPAAQAISGHAPYLEGECTTCHARNNASNPGPIVRSADQLCFDCHDEYSGGRTMVSASHREHVKNCVGCHNPHNAARRSLLF